MFVDVELNLDRAAVCGLDEAVDGSLTGREKTIVGHEKREDFGGFGGLVCESYELSRPYLHLGEIGGGVFEQFVVKPLGRQLFQFLKSASSEYFFDTDSITPHLSIIAYFG